MSVELSKNLKKKSLKIIKSLNDIKMLHNDKALCIDCMQSFCNHANFNNFNVHAIKTICMQTRKLNKMQNYKRNCL